MVSFFLALSLLIIGYFVYGRLMEKIFGVDEKLLTPAIRLKDGVDYVPLSWPRSFLIQFLNIAGLGPIFGAVAGAMWGPVAYLWIVFGNILGGAMHDFMSAMISMRMDGISLPGIIGRNLGKVILWLVLVFILLMLIIVGAVFVINPANILASMTRGEIFLAGCAFNFDVYFWAVVIVIYYFAATLLPIDKVIGKIYPFFGFLLLFMGVAVIIAAMVKGYHFPELWDHFSNYHYLKDRMPIFPMMFITIACGAISGFHATQSPMIVRCLTSEKYARRVFYGAMVMEGVIALIWAAVAMTFFGSIENLNVALSREGSSIASVVSEISFGLLQMDGHTFLSNVAAILVLLGVVAAPITTGDTAFRSARLIIGDAFSIPQHKIFNRLFIAIVLLTAGYVLAFSYNSLILWRYMGWSNQTLATITLWAITVYLYRERKVYVVALIPALFMTMVTSTYFFFAPELLNLTYNISVIFGALVTLLFSFLFYFSIKS
ncbi:MAG: carbon starvation protein A [Bacteroidales bacterium]|nr:carbon starvation protein A [Bacteroidales bacterium]